MLHPQQKMYGKYTLEACLGKGPLAETWRVSTLTGESLLLKHLSLAHTPDWKALELLEREAMVLKQLDHPRIPRLREFVRDDTQDSLSLSIFTDFIEAPSLAHHLQSEKRFSETQAKDIARQALDILGFLHNYQPAIIHRDVKPSNLLLDAQDQLYLVDFGAVVSHLHPQGSSTIIGTYGYMAPEQFSGRALPVSDLYSLGATLVHLLSGQSPATLPMDGLRLDFHEAVKVSPAFEHWLKQLLNPDPKDRFGSAQAALLALDASPHSGQEVPAPVPSPTYHLSLSHDPKHVSDLKEIALSLLMVSALGLLFFGFDPALYMGGVTAGARVMAWVPVLNFLGMGGFGSAVFLYRARQKKKHLELVVEKGHYRLLQGEQCLNEGAVHQIHGFKTRAYTFLSGRKGGLRLTALDEKGVSVFTLPLALSLPLVQEMESVLEVTHSDITPVLLRAGADKPA